MLLHLLCKLSGTDHGGGGRKAQRCWPRFPDPHQHLIRNFTALAPCRNTPGGALLHVGMFSQVSSAIHYTVFGDYTKLDLINRLAQTILPYTWSA